MLSDSQGDRDPSRLTFNANALTLNFLEEAARLAKMVDL